MPTPTAKLGLQKPLGNETFNRTAYNAVLDQIDQAAASQTQADQPFFLKSAAYDTPNNKITVTLGTGQTTFLGTLVAKTADTAFDIPNPTINTDYYLYIQSDGTFISNTTGVAVAGAVKIWKVSTGASVSTITTQDLRGQLPGSSARQVQDNLDAHTATADPHPQYVLDSEKGTANGVATLDNTGNVPAAQLGNVPPVNAATTAALGTVQVAAAPASGNPIASSALKNTKDSQLTTTAATTVATYTPTASGNFLILVYLRVATAATNVTVSVTYADAAGAQTNTLLPTQSLSVGSHSLVPLYINAVAGTVININVTAGTANQVYASASILGV